MTTRTFLWLLAFVCVFGTGLVMDAYLMGKTVAHERVLTALIHADYVTVLQYEHRRRL